MRAVVYGVGAVGGVTAAALFSSGAEVVGSARGAMLDAVRRGEVVFHDGALVDRNGIGASGANAGTSPKSLGGGKGEEFLATTAERPPVADQPEAKTLPR